MQTVNRIEKYINNITGMNPYEVSKTLNYTEDICNILTYNNDYEFYINDNYNYNIIAHLCMVKDSRTTLEVAKQLILSWIVEDLTIQRFNTLSMYYKLELNGTDKDRHFETEYNFNTTPDFKLVCPNKTYNIEFVCDYSNAWNEYGCIALRNKKYNKLHDRKDYLFLLEANLDAVTILDMSKDYIKDTLELPQYGNKESTRIYIKENNIHFYYFNTNFINNIQKKLFIKK